MTHLGLFEGIGGFSLAASWMGWETLAWCEWNEFGQKVLRQHFPNAEGFGDITKTDFTKYANRIDVLTGGFPCQPFSGAGQQLGEKHEQFLLHEMFRAISEIKPRWVVAENVYGITSPKFKSILTQIYTFLETQGYNTQAYNLPASAVECDHERQRVFFIAYSGKVKCNATKPENSEVEVGGFNTQEWSKSRGGLKLEPGIGYTQIGFYNEQDFEPTVVRKDDDVPYQLDEIATFGNAVAPNLVYQIFKTIEQYENKL